MRNITKESRQNYSIRTINMMLIILISMSAASAATYTVTNNNDSGAGSLRKAILDANASTENDTINFDQSLAASTITLTSGELIVTNNSGTLTINGLGANQLNISGGRKSRILRTNPITTVTISGITISRGNGVGLISGTGGGIYNSGHLTLSNSNVIENSSSNDGGGVFSNGILTVVNTTISGNISGANGGGIYSSGSAVTLINSTVQENSSTNGGGGVLSRIGTVKLSNSTVSNNSSTFGYGGGIDISDGILQISNSTVSNNRVDSKLSVNGGGILLYRGNATITNSTVTNNSVGGTVGAGGISRVSGTLILKNTIVAGNINNSIVPDISGNGFVSEGYNLIGNVGSVSTFNQTGDQVGNSSLPLNPLLGPLQDNGGQNFTHALLAGSSAINAGRDALAVDSNNDPLTTDQRGIGFPRFVDRVDIGAFEAGVVDSTPPDITPNISGALGNNDWYVSDIEISWSVIDEESPISDQTDCEMAIVTEDTDALTFSCMATSTGGTSLQSVTVKRDATAPTLEPSVSPNPVFLNGSATASANATDDLSGIDSESCETVVTSDVGSQSVNCTATDNAGNTANAVANYQVVYNFAGFFSPIDNLPSVNIANAGQAIPIKFSLNGYQGLSIFAPSYPSSSPIACDANEPGNIIDETVNSGGSSLTYDAASDRYQYVWKTNKTMKGTCRILIVRFIDGTEHYAKFRFK